MKIKFLVTLLVLSAPLMANKKSEKCIDITSYYCSAKALYNSANAAKEMGATIKDSCIKDQCPDPAIKCTLGILCCIPLLVLVNETARVDAKTTIACQMQ